MSSQEKQWKILELLKLTEELFSGKSINNPRLNAELLLSKTLNVERINLYTDFEKPLNQTELNQFRDKVKRRLNYEPLQYIVNEAHFYGRSFRVNSSVLIPRPETELLVEKAIDIIRETNLPEPHILEIGTGSGCISISIAANVDCRIDAIDNNENSIATAKLNASHYQLKGKISFSLSDLIKQNIKLDSYDIVISNPPYIPADEFADLPEEIRNYEPKSSLTDNGDGLTFYRRIFELYSVAKKKPCVLLEIGDKKREAVEALAGEYSISKYLFHKDLLKIERVLEF